MLESAAQSMIQIMFPLSISSSFFSLSLSPLVVKIDGTQRDSNPQSPKFIQLQKPSGPWCLAQNLSFFLVQSYEKENRIHFSLLGWVIIEDKYPTTNLKICAILVSISELLLFKDSLKTHYWESMAGENWGVWQKDQWRKAGGTSWSNGAKGREIKSPSFSFLFKEVFHH